MLNHSQLMQVVSQSQLQQVMSNMNNNIINNQYSQMTMMMHKLNNSHSHMMTSHRRLSNNNHNNNNRRGIDKRNNNNWKEVAGLKDLQQHNRVIKPKRYISKRRFSNGGKFAPRNTTSFLIRAKKAGGIASLVSPCAVTPAVLDTPVFSPSREVLVDMAKEEWGVDGYGSMNGLIRVRSSENDEKSDIEDVEEHSEVERRLDNDLSRFEMISISPNYAVLDNTTTGINNNNNGCLLENRVDDQDTHIAQLEEKSLMLKNRLILMESEFDKLRTRLQCLERRNLGAKVVDNDSANEESSELLEENKSSVVSKEYGNGGNGLQGCDDSVHMEDDTRKTEACKDEDDDHENGIAAN